jgi:glycosyltransferase involved in cell wall biosynthesis
MAHKGAEILRETYGVPDAKVDIIPHGIPDMPFVDSSFYKGQFGVEGRKVLLTFGLLGPGKGIEHVIEALPEIVRSIRTWCISFSEPRIRIWSRMRASVTA